MGNFFVSLEARADLRSIRVYGVKQFGAKVGNEYVDSIVDVFERIVARPEAGRQHPGYRKSVLRFQVYRQHKVFYDVVGSSVRIVRVLHQAMDMDSHLD